MKNRNQVVVTGIGVISALGDSMDKVWENLLQGRSSIRSITGFDTSEFSCKVGAEITDFQPEKYMDPKDAIRNDRCIQFAVASGQLAVKDAQLELENIDRKRAGVIIGSGVGGMKTIQTQTQILYERGPRKVSPFMIPSLIVNMPSGAVAINLGLKGPNFSVTSACSTGAHAIGDAMQYLQLGKADIMLAGGSEAALNTLSFAGFCSMRAMSTSFNEAPVKSCRPFDALRDGFVMGEGAVVLVLETLEHALARKAKIYGELAAYSATCDAYHITAPDPEARGLVSCYEQLLEEAGVPKEAVDYINAHGTSTPYNDKFETLAIKKAFGDHAYRLKVSSTKSMTGHLLGAAGALEAAICIKAIQTQKVPPTINYENPDPDCDLHYVPNKMQSTRVEIAITNNSGFGGHNAGLLFRAYR